jgi:hypothetical protein
MLMRQTELDVCTRHLMLQRDNVRSEIGDLSVLPQGDDDGGHDDRDEGGNGQPATNPGAARRDLGWLLDQSKGRALARGAGRNPGPCCGGGIHVPSPPKGELCQSG